MYIIVECLMPWSFENVCEVVEQGIVQMTEDYSIAANI